MKFAGRATSLDSFLKAYETSEAKRFFAYECIDHLEHLENSELPPYGAFYSRRRSSNRLPAKYTDFVNLLKSGLSSRQAVVNLKLSKPSPIGIESYQYLQQLWKQEQMGSFKDILDCYNNKVFVPILEAMQKFIAFYHDKDIDSLKLVCTLPNLVKMCLLKSADAKRYPFT